MKRKPGSLQVYKPPTSRPRPAIDGTMEVIMARPRTGNTTGNLSISINKALIEKIVVMATKKNRSKSNMAAELLVEAIEAREAKK